MSEIIESSKSSIPINNLRHYLQESRFIFLNTKPWLSEKEMSKQKSTFVLVEISDLHIYQNDEGKYKANFKYNSQNYEGFSITAPELKLKNRKISKAIILVSLPNAPYSKYGKEFYYKFICTIYPTQKFNKSYMFNCYKI